MLCGSVKGSHVQTGAIVSDVVMAGLSCCLVLLGEGVGKEKLLSFLIDYLKRNLAVCVSVIFSLE